MSAGQSHLKGGWWVGVRVQMGEDTGRVVWRQEQGRFCISNQDIEPVPKIILESWRLVSYCKIKFIFRKKMLGSGVGPGLRETS